MINYSASGTSGTVTLTTHKSHDVIIVFASAISTPEGSDNAPPAVAGIIDSSGSLVFNQRASYVTVVPDHGNDRISEEEWYAVAASPLSSDLIKVTLSSNTQELSIIGFAVSGANASSPFDPNLPGPVGVSGQTQGGISAAISTVCSNDLVIGAAVTVNPTLGAGTGYTLIASDNGGSLAQDAAAEYAIVSSLQRGLPVTFSSETQPFPPTWLVIADALN